MPITSPCRVAFLVAALIVSVTMPLAPTLAHTATHRKVGQRPEPGVEATVTVGSPLLERYNMIVSLGATVAQDVHANLGMQGDVRIPAQSLMVVTEDGKKLRACTLAQDTYTNMMQQTGAGCLIDRDEDGVFDAASARDVGFTTRKLAQPVPYTRVDVPENPVGVTNQKDVLVYLGAASGVLRLSYRQFAAGDMIRAISTDDLSYPLGPTYPQTITWRDTRITLLGLDNDGLRYRVEAAK